MYVKEKPVITPLPKGTRDSMTKITFLPDYARFNLQNITEDMISLLKKRVYDIAGTTDSAVRVYYNDELIPIKSFEDYIRLHYVNDNENDRLNLVYADFNERWSVGVIYDTNSGYQHVSFVNRIATFEGGTHVNYIVNQIVDKITNVIRDKNKNLKIKPSQIKDNITVFINSVIEDPSFSSQTKERLITEPKDFGSTHTVSDKLIKQVFASEIVASILDWIDKKKNAEEKAQLRKLNSSLSTSKILKLIDAKSRTERGNCTLGIFEGMFALSAVRKFRDAQSFGAFPLKGKFLNVSEMKNTEVIKSDEVINLMASIGLKLGEDPENLRYGKVLIYTDADPDGDAIAALLINFFNRYWPELFDQGRIYKV
jgi:DNA topoisomerase-2